MIGDLTLNLSSNWLKLTKNLFVCLFPCLRRMFNKSGKVHKQLKDFKILFRFKNKLKSRMEYAFRFIQSIISTIITQRRATNKSIMNLFFANVIFCPSIQNSVIYFLKDYDLFAYLGYTSLQFLFPSIPI